MENDKYPGADEGIKKLVKDRYIDQDALKDGWQHPYNYEAMILNGIEGKDYRLSSSGPDGCINPILSK